jgi:hypothetical protein
MGGLMLSFWLKEDKSGRRILIIGLVMLLAVVINQLASNIIPVKRSSPTLFFNNIYRVSELLLFRQKMRLKTVSRRSRNDVAYFCRNHASLFRSKSVRHSPDYFCGFCLPTRNDWRSLVH